MGLEDGRVKGAAGGFGQELPCGAGRAFAVDVVPQPAHEPGKIAFGEIGAQAILELAGDTRN